MNQVRDKEELLFKTFRARVKGGNPILLFLLKRAIKEIYLWGNCRKLSYIR
jgi:hypothetical protein